MEGKENAHERISRGESEFNVTRLACFNMFFASTDFTCPRMHESGGRRDEIGAANPHRSCSETGQEWSGESLRSSVRSLCDRRGRE